MNDTSTWAAATLAELYARRSGCERLAMASGLFDAARALQIASLRQQVPSLSPAELRLRLLERTYRADFTIEGWEQILALWRQRESGPHSPPAG